MVKFYFKFTSRSTFKNYSVCIEEEKHKLNICPEYRRVIRMKNE